MYRPAEDEWTTWVSQGFLCFNGTQHFLSRSYEGLGAVVGLGWVKDGFAGGCERLHDLYLFRVQLEFIASIGGEIHKLAVSYCRLYIIGRHYRVVAGLPDLTGLRRVHEGRPDEFQRMSTAPHKKRRSPCLIHLHGQRWQLRGRHLRALVRDGAESGRMGRGRGRGKERERDRWID